MVLNKKKLNKGQAKKSQLNKSDLVTSFEKNKDMFEFENKDKQVSFEANKNTFENKDIQMARTKPNNNSSFGLLFFAAGIGFTFVLLLIFFIALLLAGGLYSNSDGNRVLAFFGQEIKENSFVVVPISGKIGNCDGCADAQKISKSLLDLKDNKKVKAIILDINSPGGGVAETEEIIYAVKEVKQNKLIVSVISQKGASGAYFIAGATDKIFVHPHAIVGSLGVVISYKYYQELYEKIGINVSVFKSGEMKDMGSNYRSPTSEEQKRFQTIVDSLYNDLFSEFTANRNISSENLELIKAGSIFLGNEAISFGLADKIGGQKQAVDYLSKILNITNPNIKEYNIDKAKDIFSIDNFARAIGEGIANQILTNQKQINIKS